MSNCSWCDLPASYRRPYLRHQRKCELRACTVHAKQLMQIKSSHGSYSIVRIDELRISEDEILTVFGIQPTVRNALF